MNVIAETQLAIILPGETAVRPLRLAVANLRQCDDGDWSCDAVAEGLEPLFGKPSVSVCGVDSWQALTLAQSLLHTKVRTLLDRGGRLMFPEDEGEDDDLPELEELPGEEEYTDYGLLKILFPVPAAVPKP